MCANPEIWLYGVRESRRSKETGVCESFCVFGTEMISAWQVSIHGGKRTDETNH